MSFAKKHAVLLSALGGVVVAGLAIAARQGWLGPGDTASNPLPDHHDQHQDRVRLSPQARANLGLVVKPIALQSYVRTIQVPGMVVEHQGKSEHGVTAPLAGVVKHVAAFQGTTVRPGDELFTLRLVSETLHNTQAELYKTTREMQITQDQKQRLEKAGVVPEARILELEYQQRRLAAAAEALRFALASRGLAPDQIQQVAKGEFVSEIVVRVPPQHRHEEAHAASRTVEQTPLPPVYEVEELKVHLGDHVQAGQILCSLANHQSLYVEGRAFKDEIPLVERAAAQGWAIEADFADMANTWPPLEAPLKIRFLGNRLDAGSQTLPFYITLPNSFREHTHAGRTYRTWRFNPGQRVRLRLPVEQLSNVFVLPAEAVVREGPEAYVFRANGDVFDRKSVHVLHEDRRHVLIAPDGSINEGNHIAHNGAAQLNRVLKAQSAGEDHDHHHHHDH
jgi:multidrug efflux pump subunit AcrA (membrane-fusion protein)